MDYSVDVHSVPVRLVDDQGHAEEASLFISGTADGSFDVSTLLKRLDEPESRFLPCEIAGHVELVQVDRVAYVEFREQLPSLVSLEEVGAERTPVTLLLVDHESVSGDLIYEAPAEHCRVSDLLNRNDLRFLILSSPGVIRLIHRQAILRVRV